MTKEQLDIRDRRDVACLVNVFYDRVRADDVLGPIFDDIAHVDWPTHSAAHVRLLGIGAVCRGNVQGSASGSAPHIGAAHSVDERGIRSVDRLVSHDGR